MPTDLSSALRAHFGFSSFRPGQREVMEHLLNGKSAAALFPTGSGKSLCYQLPALLLEGATIIVSPLIALMRDQIDALAARGIAAARLDSTLSHEQYRDVMKGLRSGALRLLYVAPERFQNERFREAIQHLRVSLFAVDEAHCISEWGHNFRPDYLKLVEFVKQCRAERVLALTATATPAVLKDIRRAFAIEEGCAVRTGFYRANLRLLSTPVEASERDGVLLSRLRERPAGPTIVYVTLQKTAEEVAGRLCAAGFKAKAYHAGLDDGVRSSIQDWFLETRAGIVVATIAFGMGVDKPDIRYVYHYNLPKSLENYSQEIGRSGRDGALAICEIFVCLKDLTSLENFAYGDTPTLPAVQGLVRELFSLGERFDVSFHELSRRHDIRILVLRTLITYLELKGYLLGGTPFFSAYKFKPRKTSAEILGHFKDERRQFLKQLLLQTRKIKKWYEIDIDEASRTLNTPRARIVRALDYLGERGWIELQARGTRNQYTRLISPEDLPALAAGLHRRTEKREQSEVSRLHQVLKLIEFDGCQVAALCHYFGEKLTNDCGHCTWCLNGRRAIKLGARRSGVVPEKGILQRAEALRRQHEALKDPVLLTRFLCGVTSPALSKAKLTSDSLFGALSHVPFLEVRRYFEGAKVPAF